MPTSSMPVSNDLAMTQNQSPTLSLNSAQREAVTTTEGPVLVLAGAGTGKTRVLTARIAYILRQHLAWPSQVLAVTFTNKAAQEMKSRVEDLLGQPAEGMWLGTFHSLSTRILRYNADLVGLESNFTILDVDDQIRLIKQILKADNVDDKKVPAKGIAHQISSWKDKGWTPDKVPASDAKIINNGITYNVYKQYQERLKTLNAVDFGDLLLHSLNILNDHPDVLAKYQQQFKYILVDEYQDTNVVQYLWLRLLSQRPEGEKANICCVGDDDQSIYGWRGAEVENILRFEKDFKDATVIRLEENYRSTKHILGAASGLIANNEGRFGKTLWTSIDVGEKVIVRSVWDGEEEARWIGEEIENLHRKKHPLSSIAILIRAGFQTREFEDRLLKIGVPYKVIGGPRFYERMEIRDALAYLRCVVQPSDSLAFERIINTPKRGVGTAALQTLHLHARAQNIPLAVAALQLIETDEIRGAARKSIQDLLTDIARWRSNLETMDRADLARQILDESGYTRMWKDSKKLDAPTRLENLKEFINAIQEFESIPHFLEHVSLVMDNNSATGDMDVVNIMTVHSAKGLEFETVFLAGWEEGLFPHQNAIDENGQEGIEEERRLAYVAITRAKERAIITHAANRRMYNRWQSAMPSRFLQELPAEHIEKMSSTGFYGARQSWNQGGWNNQRHAAVHEPYKTIKSTPSYSQTPGIQLGSTVYHQKFGEGLVIDVDGDRLSVNFENVGVKKVLVSFVEAR